MIFYLFILIIYFTHLYLSIIMTKKFLYGINFSNISSDSYLMYLYSDIIINIIFLLIYSIVFFTKKNSFLRAFVFIIVVKFIFYVFYNLISNVFSLGLFFIPISVLFFECLLFFNLKNYIKKTK